MKIKKYQNSGIITRSQVHKPTQYESDMAKKGYIRFRDQKGRLYNYVPEGYSIINNSGKQVEEKDTDYNYGYTLPELVVERPAYTQHEKEVAEYARNNPNTFTIEGIDQSKWEDQRGFFGNIRDALNVTDTRNDESQPLYKRLLDKALWELDSHNPSGGLEGAVSNPGLMVMGAAGSSPLQLIKFLGSGIALNNLTTPFTGKTIGQHIGDVAPIVTGTTGDVMATSVGGGFGNKLINKGYNYYTYNKNNRDYKISDLFSNRDNQKKLDLGEIIGSTRETLQNVRDYYHSNEFKSRLRNAGFSDEDVYRTIYEIENIMQKSQNQGVIINKPSSSPSRLGYSQPIFKLTSKYRRTPQYQGNKTVVYPDKNNPGDFINTLLHEYGGHSSTGTATGFPDHEVNYIEYPMIFRMMEHNNKLPLRFSEQTGKFKDLLDAKNFKGLASEYDKPWWLPRTIFKRMAKKQGRFLFDYLNEGQEKRARAFGELLEGVPDAYNTEYDIYDPGDWNAYVKQFLKKGGKVNN